MKGQDMKNINEEMSHRSWQKTHEELIIDFSNFFAARRKYYGAAKGRWKS